MQLQWKEILRCRCFLMNFARYLRQRFYKTPSGGSFCFTGKYFTNKLEKTLWKKKYWKLLVRKTATHVEKDLITTCLKSSCPFTIRKSFYCTSLLSMMLRKDVVLETMRSHWGFIYNRKLFLTYGNMTLIPGNTRIFVGINNKSME